VDAIRELFCLNRKFLVYNLVTRNLKVRYRRSVLGFFWTLGVPAAMTLVYLVVFKFIARVEVENYGLLLVTGIIPWTFFSSAILTGTDSIVANFSLLSKVPVAHNAFPLADVTAGFINLLLSLPVLLIAALYYGRYPDITWLLFLFYYGCLFIQAYAGSLIFAIAFVYLRDIRHMTAILMQIWFYLTPVLYSTDLIPEKYQTMFMLNPLYMLFDSIHKTLLKNELPSSLAVLHICAWTLLLIVMAMWFYRRTKPQLVERI
jgi:lipopolysaccharide transport system permease protein